MITAIYTQDVKDSLRYLCFTVGISLDTRNRSDIVLLKSYGSVNEMRLFVGSNLRHFALLADVFVWTESCA